MENNDWEALKLLPGNKAVTSVMHTRDIIQMSTTEVGLERKKGWKLFRDEAVEAITSRIEESKKGKVC